MSLLRKVYAVIGQWDVPLSGVGKADAHSLCQNPAELGEGAGAVNELLTWYPRSQGHRWRCDQQDFALIQGEAGEEPLQPLDGLLRASTLEQIVGAQHNDQQVAVIWESRSGRGDLPAILPQVGERPAGLCGQDVHPPAVRVIAPAEMASRIIAVCIGVAEADDVHPVLFLSLNVHIS